MLILAPEAYLPVRQVGVHFHDSAERAAGRRGRRFAVIEDADAHAGTGAGTPARAGRRAGAGRRVVHLSRRRPPALSHLSVRVAPGEIVALTGPSGGGKSTALQLVMGFLTPSEGRVLVGPDDLTALDHTAWRRQLAWVGQDPGMVRGTIADNVRLGHPGASAAQVRSAPGPGRGHPAGRDRPWATTARDCLPVSAAASRWPAPCCGSNWAAPGCWCSTNRPPAWTPATEARAVETVRATGAAALIVSHRPAVLAMADEVVTVAEPAAIVLADKEADR